MTGKVSGNGNVGGLVGSDFRQFPFGNSYGNAHIEGRYAGVILGGRLGMWRMRYIIPMQKGVFTGIAVASYVGGLTGGLDNSLKEAMPMSLYREVVIEALWLEGEMIGSIYNSYGVGSVAGGEGNAGGLIGIGD